MPRRLLLISDGKPGHVSTSRGMAALARGICADLETQELNIHLRAKFLRPLLRVLINSNLNRRLDAWLGLNWPRAFYQGYQYHPAELVLSTGGDTLYLNVIEGNGRGRSNVFCGSLRGVRSELISLIVHTRISGLPNWQAMQILPSAVRPEQTEMAAAAYAESHLHGARDSLWSLLIGGDGSGYRYSDEDIRDLLKVCVELATRHGKRVLVSTSRRTGAPAERMLAAWLAAHPDAPVAGCVLYGQRPEKVAAAFMGLSELVFCTEDSTSMISESVLNRRPLITLSGNNASPVPDHKTFLEQLSANQRIMRTRIDKLGNIDLAAFLSAWRPDEGLDNQQLRKRLADLLK
jgi:hypothetical protein